METQTTSTNAPAEKPISQLPRRLVRFAEIYATGLHSQLAAAREAGYSPKTAHKNAYKWLGKTRQDSEYPTLWDYYEKLRRENLREFDVSQNTIARELALIAFSDLTRFIELPKKEYELKAQLARDTSNAIYAIQEYPAELAAYEKALAKQEQQTRGKKKKLVKPQPPTDRQRKLYNDYAAMNDEDQRALMFWAHYRAGSIRLRNQEEIPAALYPTIAELSETKDGIKLKLHDKIAALDKLARWTKMYSDREPENPDGNIVTEISITVNGSRSKLVIPAQDEEKAA